jgi:hemolysin activation/secretion protein
MRIMLSAVLGLAIAGAPVLAAQNPAPDNGAQQQQRQSNTKPEKQQKPSAKHRKPDAKPQQIPKETQQQPKDSPKKPRNRNQHPTLPPMQASNRGQQSA